MFMHSRSTVKLRASGRRTGSVQVYSFGHEALTRPDFLDILIGLACPLKLRLHAWNADSDPEELRISCAFRALLLPCLHHCSSCLTSRTPPTRRRVRLRLFPPQPVIPWLK